ncbi:hypothetical protein JYU29_08115 [Tianweitania sp. BSSL-BM11]|uniref:Uncharacterized protein n=1 Tax=Tianweitania aestuarii TaxID=2814886 RepID=A0ABS5RUB8_9HYPH|nr:hypothetical protein [Tianweitania aestuarii]MBS9720648.1 hypothetical protein [Tianweitania aestuarii]
MSDHNRNDRDLREPQAEKLMPSTGNDEFAKFPDTGDPGDRPRKPYGLTEPMDKTSESVRTSEGVAPVDSEPPEEAFIDEKLQRERTL